MTDAELIKFLGIDGEPKAQALVDRLSPAKRSAYERMASLESDIALWQAGFGPKPTGVLMDFPRKGRSFR